MTHPEEGQTIICEFVGGVINRTRWLGETGKGGTIKLEGQDPPVDTVRKFYRLDKTLVIGGRLYAFYVVRLSKRPVQRPEHCEPFDVGYEREDDDDDHGPYAL